MKLSVIIPVYNEKSTILKIIKRVEDVPVEKEIIVVDDGSKDGTKEVLIESQKSKVKSQNFKIIFKEK
ncbi:MAG: glycosyltransferase, partial [Candidatus Omnitrophica bacterium]|nr:glycosyltransferase [Candidatus Omnitrophota bacterium]